MTIRTRTKKWLVALAVTAVTAVNAGCGGGSHTANGSASANAGSATKHYRIIWAGSQPASTPFAAVLVNGFTAAAKLYGVDAEYRGPSDNTFDASQVRRVIDNAAAAKPDAVIVSNFDPKSLDPAIKAITAKGIPVVTVNAGADSVIGSGALAYVGTDEFASGLKGGQMLTQEGATHALLVTAVPGIPNVDARNAGFKKGFAGTVATAALSLNDLADSTKVKNVITAGLQKDSTIDAVFTVGDCCSAAMIAARGEIGSRAGRMHWATIDLGQPVLTAIKSGAVNFALDQQPWLQGFFGVQTLVQYLRYGFTPGSATIPTGPVVVDKSNIDRVINLSVQKVR
jgi:simple sugar transport system substrate-binding protein